MKAVFVTSAVAPEGFPRERLPEIALAGRSNVGKSTLINTLVRQTLARTSAKPGKTRLANFYRVAPRSGPPFHRVDLPGYGYAGGGAAAAREFAAITGAYFEDRRRDRLAGVLLVVDSRHPGLEPDRQAWAWLGTLGVARHLVATKLDKLSRAARAASLQAIARVHDSPVVGVSAETGEGMKPLWNLLDTLVRPPRPGTTPPPPPTPRNR